MALVNLDPPSRPPGSQRREDDARQGLVHGQPRSGQLRPGENPRAGTPFGGPDDARVKGDASRGGGSTYDNKSPFDGYAPRKGRR
jgi:hypothetical protein